MMENRRKYERYPVVFGSDVDSPKIEARIGLTQDLSRKGARLLTLAPYGIGTHIKLRIIVNDETAAECNAEILREKRISDRGMWQYEIAVEFDTELPEEVVTELLDVSVRREF